jgi:hypothetical protein
MNSLLKFSLKLVVPILIKLVENFFKEKPKSGAEKKALVIDATKDAIGMISNDLKGLIEDDKLGKLINIDKPVVIE